MGVQVKEKTFVMSGKGKSGCGDGTFFLGFYLGGLVILSWISFVVFTDMSNNPDCASSVAKWELETLRYGSLGIGGLTTFFFVILWAGEALRIRSS